MVKVAQIEYVNLPVRTRAGLALGLVVRTDGVVVSLPMPYIKISVSTDHVQYINKTYNPEAKGGETLGISASRCSDRLYAVMDYSHTRGFP